MPCRNRQCWCSYHIAVNVVKSIAILTSAKAQNILNNSAKQNSIVRNWLFVNDGRKYNIINMITLLPKARVLLKSFKSSTTKRNSTTKPKILPWNAQSVTGFNSKHRPIRYGFRRSKLFRMSQRFALHLALKLWENICNCYPAIKTKIQHIPPLNCGNPTKVIPCPWKKT